MNRFLNATPRFSVALAVIAAWSSTTLAGIITLGPTDLNAGDTYHLAFVTSTTRTAQSSAIGDYDAFVQAAANAAGNGLQALTWKAVGSTATVNAIDHIGVSGFVYRLDDTRIANSESDFFDETLQAAINVNELGDFTDVNVWTGSEATGVMFTDRTLGNPAGVRFGLSNNPTFRWANNSAHTPDGSFHIYAISEALTVAVPEPSAGAFMSAALTGLVAYTWRRRQRRGGLHCGRNNVRDRTAE